MPKMHSQLVTNVSPLMRRMQGLHGKYMADPQTRDELLKIVAAGSKG